MAANDMGDLEEHHLAVSEASLARRKLVDRIVVGGVSIISGVIVVFVILFVVVDKMNQAPESGKAMSRHVTSYKMKQCNVKSDHTMSRKSYDVRQ